jgi:4-hydroxy-4-methyl-2-oxoglutarate aldolase
MIGDGMAKLLYSVGCLGLVSDGRVRDISGLISTPFAAYCKGRIAHHCPLRIRAVDRPVDIGGVTIHPGDIVHANSEGVIRIPPSCIDRLAAAAVKNRAFEHDVHRFLRRTDASPQQKRDHVQKLIAQYNFADCMSESKTTTESNSISE